MKFTSTLLSFAALLLTNPLALVQAASSDDVDGEASIKVGDCELDCEWGANEDRRLLRGGSNTIEKSTFKFGEQTRELGVDLANIECTVTIGDDEFTKTITFPDGWLEVYKEGGDADDYYGFVKAITVRCFVISL